MIIPKDLVHGYVGFYTVVGRHAICLGDEGNWNDLQETIRFREIAFPQRRGNYNIRITDKLKQLDSDTEDFYVAIVADYCKPLHSVTRCMILRIS